MAEITIMTPWDRSQKIGFRFFFAFFILYCLPFPADWFPFLEWLTRFIDETWNTVVVWTGAHVLQLAHPVTIRPAGSGDTTWNYVHLLIVFVLSGMTTVVWSWLDRRRAHYRTLHEWLRIYVRLYLGTTLIRYGAFKVIQTQFPPLEFDRLMQPFGEASPMGLLWTFMGASYVYNVFVGACEMLGGILLFFRRTTLFGALVAIAVMSNVVMLNFAYDVPVKLFSSALLLMAILLAAPDLHRLINLLVLNRTAPPGHEPPLFRRRSWNRAVVVLELLFLAFASYTMLDQSAQAHAARDPPADFPLAGAYAVDLFILRGDTIPPLAHDPERWRRFVIRRTSVATIHPMAGEWIPLQLQADSAATDLRLFAFDDSVPRGVFALSRPDSVRLILNGRFDGRPIEAHLRRIDARSFLLVGRGFHWINETPFNR